VTGIFGGKTGFLGGFLQGLKFLTAPTFALATQTLTAWREPLELCCIASSTGPFFGRARFNSNTAFYAAVQLQAADSV
jgi:hypothetical protein